MWTDKAIEAARDVILRKTGARIDAETMRAALEAADAAMWEPIETAPEDGTEFLAWDKRAGKADVCDRDHEGAVYQAQFDYENGQLPDEFGYDMRRDVKHWRPLSTPPKEG